MTTIHLIERDASARLAARCVLERAGFAVTESVDEAVAETVRPDLIIADPSDIALIALRRRHSGVRVLAFGTAEFASADRAAVRLTKPFTPSQLLAAVRRCLARPGATTGQLRR